MANEQNLVPQAHKLTLEEQSAGGKASGIARREKADLRKKAQLWLETEVAKDEKTGKTLTGAEFMVVVAAKEIKKGNPKFWELMRDTAGQKPVEKVMFAEVEQSVIDEIENAVYGGQTDADNGDGAETDN